MNFLKKKVEKLFRKDLMKESESAIEQDIDISSKELVLQNNNELANLELEGLELRVEELPLDFKLEVSGLYEIKDESHIARLSALVYSGIQTTLPNISNKGLQNSIKSAGTLIKSDLPFSKLADSVTGGGGKRAFIMKKTGIERNAILTKFDSSKLTQSGKVAGGVAGVMSIASLVVGQYYMNEVNIKLVNINKNMNSIGDFQQQEFKSRILTLINNVREISKFSSEILNNSELRISELNQLNNSKTVTIELLEQVNGTMQSLTNEEITKIEQYQSKVYELEKLLGYQEILTSILEENSKLVFALNLGRVSIEKCFSSYDNVLIHSLGSKTLIQNWHLSIGEKLKIEVQENRIKKQGLERIVFKPLTLIDKKWDYKRLESNLKNIIVKQCQNNEVEINNIDNPFDENIELIIKGDKYYYRPSTSNEKPSLT